MPYKSTAQQGFFHAHAAELAKQGVDVHEWDKATKQNGGFSKLPEHVKQTEQYHNAHKRKPGG